MFLCINSKKEDLNFCVAFKAMALSLPPVQFLLHPPPPAPRSHPTLAGTRGFLPPLNLALLSAQNGLSSSPSL